MTPLQASPMTLSTSTPFNKTHPSPIYIDAIQLGLQLYVASLASKVRRREFPLDRYPLTKFFPTGRIKISRSGFISIGSNYNNGDRCYLSTNGAKIFRGVTGAGEPHARTKKAAKTVDNQLTLQEKKRLQEIVGETEPWAYQVDQFLDQLPMCIAEAKLAVCGNYSNVDRFCDVPVKLRRIQFYREYSSSNKSIAAIINQFSISIAPSLGACESEVTYDKIWKESGALKLWKIQVRSKAGVAKKRSEKALLIVYYKGDQLRVEYSRDYPRHADVVCADASALRAITSNLAEEARSILDKIHNQLETDPVDIPETEIYAALNAYGVRRPESRLDWVNFADQRFYVRNPGDAKYPAVEPICWFSLSISKTHYWDVMGVEMSASVIKSIFVLLLLSGCVTNNRGKVQDLAAFDLGCDKEKIKITPMQSGVYVGDPQYGAEGCGKRARYICTEQHGCLKNSETTK